MLSKPSLSRCRVQSNLSFQTEHSWSTTGKYDLVVTVYNDDYPFGVSATSQVTVISGNYVNANNNQPKTPYLSWPDAATNIQDAVDAAADELLCPSMTESASATVQAL